MDSKMLGSPIELELRGEKYKFSPLTTGDFSDLAAFLKERDLKLYLKHAPEIFTPDHKYIEKIKELLGKDLKQNQNAMTLAQIFRDVLGKEKSKFIEDILGREIPVEELMRRMGSIDGIRFLIWCSLKKHRPNMKLDDIDELVSMDNLGEINRLVQAISAPPDSGEEAKKGKAPRKSTKSSRSRK